jgi:5-oxoprolinase (ATP-hydrolysing)
MGADARAHRGGHDAGDGVRVGADVGGTFTDIVAHHPDGRLTFRKVLSTPPRYDHAVVDGLRSIRAALDEDAPISGVVHATTVATNAVLERRGARTALVTTSGFRDILELRRVRVPQLYDTFWVKPESLVPRELRFEVEERVMADGRVLTPLDVDGVRRLAARLRQAQIETVAVCFLHAHRHPEHEREAGEILRQELPGVPISLSSEVIREQQEYERTAATAVNAYVRPLMERYVTSLQDGLRELGIDGELTLMQSSGGVMDASTAALCPVYVLESGPAAGVVAALALALRHGIRNAIAFDMGGTTAKASLIEDGRVAWSREYEVGAGLSSSRFLRGEGEIIRVPTLDIAEVGAGGGSIAWIDTAGGLHVGPRSAGADPGPACYGNGGHEATVTDANVVLGYIPPGKLADGSLVVSLEQAQQAVDVVAAHMQITREEAARGIHELANASMMRALRAVSSEKGRDPADFALIAYGGSGPVHAAGLAEELAIEKILVPPVAGGFSAAGLLFARPEFHDVRFCRVDARSDELSELHALERDMRDALAVRGGDDGEVTWRRTADVRYRGQSWDIEIDLHGEDIDAAALRRLVADFEREHERTYGVREDDNAPIEVRALRLAMLGAECHTDATGVFTPNSRAGTTVARRVDFRDDRGFVDCLVSGRHAVAEGGADGPVLVDEYDTTVVVPPGWQVLREGDGTLVLTRMQHAATRSATAHAQTVTRGIVGNALASIADEMAMTIFRTAHSTIVRDCMDFSASICGPTGETVAQAVTLPVHLGATPPAVRTLLAEYGNSMRAGDVFIMNDPFGGGMHTPDVFIIKPILLGRTTLGYAVTTAHHADVGGRVVGTASCDNTDIFQEGLRIPWMRLYDAGRPVDSVFKFLRANVHLPNTTLGDIRAQIAGCTIGERAVQSLARKYTPRRLRAIMTNLLDYTEELVRHDVASWPDGSATFTDYLDSDGIELRDVAITATVTIEGDEVRVDLTESSPMVRGALNCTKSSAEASAYHAVMSAVSADLPTTAGAFRPITVITKPGTIMELVMPAACSMRGVTGFRILDAINGALAQLIPDRIPAASEGGNSLAVFASRSGEEQGDLFYELVVGTWGARPGHDGNDGVSNPCSVAANIPVEVAEADFPILIERYGFVPDSGGPGTFRGGLAIERAWRTLSDETALSVRSDRQMHRPYGLRGGSDGSPSANVITDDRGSRSLPPMFSTDIERGTRYHHRTAGGGGWGDPLERDPAAVMRDVLAEKVSREAALAQYGVALTDAGAVEDEQTAAVRAGIRHARGSTRDALGDHDRGGVEADGRGSPVAHGRSAVTSPPSDGRSDGRGDDA